MATGTGKFSTTSRFRVTRSFHFAIGPRSNWVLRLAAIPVAILALVFGMVSIVILVWALVFLGIAFGIRRRWLQSRALGAANAGDVLRAEEAPLLAGRGNARRLIGRMDSSK